MLDGCTGEMFAGPVWSGYEGRRLANIVAQMLVIVNFENFNFFFEKICLIFF
jgi:hypothetical protein